ncbi:hypothetical protein UB51_18330 [Paenibacillus sp. IHBB 10380]|nr:hypothetical protein UB51_18330 [Paenibacillus sp. IHBB 10380]
MSKKLFAGLLSLAVFSLLAVTANAANDLPSSNNGVQAKEIVPIKEIMSINETMPIGDRQVENQSYYNSFTGTVKKISDVEGVAGTKYVLVENAEGGIANFVISTDTYLANVIELAEGSTITGYYEANAPMILIYPAQYNVKVITANHPKDENIKVDLFDKDLVSADHSLQLNKSDQTTVVSQDGKAFEGELTNRKLVVSYGISTRSIPAQTTPTKIVVLFEKEVPPIHQLTDEEMSTMIGDVSTMEIVVNDKIIKAPAAFINEGGTVMVPLRAIAEALEYDLTWNNKLKSIMFGEVASLKIGEDNYKNSSATSIQLGASPQLVGNNAFVPLSFFKTVVGMNHAYVFEAQIVISNDEAIME